jgi:hypothetical protein
MPYGSIDLPDCWGVDTALAGILTDEQLAALAKATLPNGQRIRFLWGYVPLPGNSSKWDMTAERLRAVCDAGFVALLVQHCRSGSWTASEATGISDGLHAAGYAAGIGYGADCHLAMDDESLRNPGPDVFKHVTGWCKQYGAPCIYEGFDPGLTPDQEYEIPDCQRYWGAYGPWNVSVRDVCCRQALGITINGVGYDPDHAFPDKLGGVLWGWCRTDLVSFSTSSTGAT